MVFGAYRGYTFYKGHDRYNYDNEVAYRIAMDEYYEVQKERDWQRQLDIDSDRYDAEQYYKEHERMFSRFD